MTKPNAARPRSLSPHATFGIGLYLADWAAFCWIYKLALTNELATANVLA
jgi:hypothetical protein